MGNSIVKALEKWGSRAAVHEDAKTVNPDLEMVAVHRWFQRGSVPKIYIPHLVKAGKKRKISVTVEELSGLDTHNEYQAGHSIIDVQPSGQKSAEGTV